MWYFSWILGLGFACTFAVLNALWFELKAEDTENTGNTGNMGNTKKNLN